MSSKDTLLDKARGPKRNLTSREKPKSFYRYHIRFQRNTFIAHRDINFELYFSLITRIFLRRTRLIVLDSKDQGRGVHKKGIIKRAARKQIPMSRKKVRDQYSGLASISDILYLAH
jgi:hypothetical protein